MDLEMFVRKYRNEYMSEVEKLSKINPYFEDYATELFDNNPEAINALHKVYLSKEVSDVGLQDAFKTIALYALMHFENQENFIQTSSARTFNKDVAAFVFSEGKGSRLSLMGLNKEKAMLEIPGTGGFSPLVQLAYSDLRANGINSVFTTSSRTRQHYEAIFGNNDNVILTEEPGNNKYEAFVECVKSLEKIPTLIFRTCGDTLRCKNLLREGIEKHLGLSNPEDYIIVVARVLDKTKKNGLSSVSVKTEGDIAINFTKSPKVLPGNDVLLYKVGSLIGKNMLGQLMDAGNLPYNTFCNTLPEGKVLLMTGDSSENKGIDDVFDLQEYTKEITGVESLYDAVRERYGK